MAETLNENRMRRYRFLTTASCALLAALATPVAGQLTIGLEGGIAAVDDRTGTQPSGGISLLWPVGQYFVGALSYAQWFPDDRVAPPADTDLTGERALNLVGYLRLTRSTRVLLLLGAGLGQLERVRTSSGTTERGYDGALTASTMGMLRLTTRTAVYLRADVATPTGDWSARWGFVHLGLSASIF